MPATLNLVFGPIGAGKTTYAHGVARREGAVAFVLDEWGVRLFGPDVQGPLDLGWMMERLGRCNALIWSTATAVLGAGTSVVLDLGLMRREQRERIGALAQDAGLSVQWHFVDAPLAVRRARVAGRNETRGETFAREVPPQMFDMIEAMYEAPTPAELEGAVLNVTDDGAIATPREAPAEA
jgi:predicted kinase